MKVLPFEQRQQHIAAFNAKQSMIARQRPYIPLEITETTDTTSGDWQFHCMVIHILNKPTYQQRIDLLEKIKQRSKTLYDQLMAVLPNKSQEHFG